MLLLLQGVPAHKVSPRNQLMEQPVFIIAHLIVRLKGLDAWSSNMHVVAFIVLDERGYLVGP